ncbi:MAG: bacterioferritin-associated ferredoxin [Oligoflexales bacterium]
MFVCLCFGLSEKRLREVVAQGGSTLKELQSRCGAGSSCGSCIDDLKKVLSQPDSANDTTLSDQETTPSSKGFP